MLSSSCTRSVALRPHRPLHATLSDNSEYVSSIYNTSKSTGNSYNNSKENTNTNSPMTPRHSRSGGYLSNRYHHPYVDNDRGEKVTINVSGERYQTYVETLDHFPHTLLGNHQNVKSFMMMWKMSIFLIEIETHLMLYYTIINQTDSFIVL